MKGSETIVIKRSQIAFNPQNIKRHSDDQIKLQKKNLKRVGLLGGIVWNASSQHLIDGHRRVMALDEINKYDGSPEKDYDIKVEKVEFDDKTEKSQMAFMALANTKADYNLIAPFINEIDYRDVGLSDYDYQQILSLNEHLVQTPEQGMANYSDAFLSPVEELDTDELTNEDIEEIHRNKPKMTKEEVKEQKQHCDNVATNRHSVQDTYVFLSFDNVENKCIFCELMGIEPTNSMMIPGEDVMKLIQ